MRIRIWSILSIGFGTLIALVALSGWLAYVRATSTYAGISDLYQAEHDAQKALTAIRSDIAFSAILVRDFLLDPNLSSGSASSEMDQVRMKAAQELARLEQVIPKQQSGQLASLRKEVDVYWASLEPLVKADASERSRLRFSFVQKDIVPRRQAALRVLTQIEQFSSEAFRQHKSDIDSRNAGLAFYLGRMVGVTLVIAIFVAAISIWRMHSLERSADLQHKKVQAAEDQLRRLSQQLVRTQEEERRALSRDLHDQVGQMLTALSMSVGNLALLAEGGDGRATQELDVAKRLVTQALRSTRDLAMGLRPTMLDDLGLEAALEWYARQHAKLYGVPVSLKVHAPLGQLSDQQRTCIYRIVQEALNNSAKYAQARNVSVDVSSSDEFLFVEITDNGRGFDTSNGHGRGLGLLGMRERVAQLGGKLVIESSANRGTRISVALPLVQTAA